VANTLEIVIKATDKARKEISGIGKSIDGLKGVASAALTGVGVAAGAAVAAVGAVGAALGKLAVDALPLQGIEGAFGGITGDAEAMLAALQEGSQGMITNKNLMMSYNLAAQLVGKQFADQLPDAMQYLTKVASATGQDMGFMMDSLVKGVGRLSPMILDNLGIQVSLEEATARAAEMFGVEADALTKAQQQAGMMDVVLEKLKTNTASMPEVAGTAAQQWAALGVTFQNTKDSIGLALIPALQSIMEPLSGLIDRALPVLVEWFEGKAVPAIEKVAGAIGIFFEGLVNGRGFVESFKDALWKMLPPQLAAQVTGIIDKIGEFAAKIQEFVSEHAEAFKAALIAIGAVIAGAAVAGAILSIAGTIAALANPITLIIVAIGLLAAAWTENWGGIREKMAVVWAWLQPILALFREWLAVNLPIAIQALTDFWTNTLLPAIEDVWTFIQNDLVPLFESLWELIKVAGALAITALTGLWQNVLLPALRKVWEFIQNNVVPIFNRLNTAVGGVSGAVASVIGWIDRMAERLRNIKLPDWLTPGSPTPFEMGLRGISKALKDISTAQLPEFNAQLNVNRTGPVGAGAAASQAPGRGGNEYHLHIHTAAPTENIMADFAVLQALAG
jgi:hypothetical protein